MTFENLLSQMGVGTKQIVDRYSEVPVHDHHVYYAYESSAPSHGSVATSKHSNGGSHKSNASMSALTLLAFLFFLHILQQCIKDHMTDMNTPPVMVMTAGREGDDVVSKTTNFNKLDKASVTRNDVKDISENDRMDVNLPEKHDLKNLYHNDGSSTKNQVTTIKTIYKSKPDEQRNRYVYRNYGNRSLNFAGFVSAMDEK